MKIYFTNFSDYDVKSYEISETATVEEFIEIIDDFEKHKDLDEIVEIKIALHEEENPSLRTMMDIFNDIVEENSDEFRVYTYEETGFFDGDELNVSIRDINTTSFGINDQMITFKNLKTDTVGSFIEGIKTWLNNLQFEVYREENFFDCEYTKEKFEADNAVGIKKFNEFIDSGEFRELLTPSDEEYYDTPNIINLIDQWNNGVKLSRAVYNFLDVETLMEEK